MKFWLSQSQSRNSQKSKLATNWLKLGGKLESREWSGIFYTAIADVSKFRISAAEFGPELVELTEFARNNNED